MANFTIKIFKSAGGRSDRGQFSNSYDVDLAGEAVTAAEVDTIVTALVTVERSFMLNTVHFMRAVVSTAAKEGRKPYRPETFRSIELTGTGTRPVEGTEPMPLEVAAVIKHNVAYGRPGRQTYRGCLTEASVTTSPAGIMSFTGEVHRFNEAWTGFHQAHPGVLIINPVTDNAGDDAGGAAQTLRTVTSSVFSGLVVRKKTRRKKKREPARTEEEAKSFLEQASELVVRAQAFVNKNPTFTNLALRAAVNGLAKAIGNSSKAIDDAIPDLPALPPAP